VDPVAAFFRACEEGASRAQPDPSGDATADQPSWLRDLAAATAAQLTFDTTRARELLERARMRLGRVELAEEAMTDALAIVDDGPVRTWMADTVASRFYTPT
jgi:hypothetical protein